MALSPHQQSILKVLADRRFKAGICLEAYENQSYFAGGAALNATIGGSRYSVDIDIFNGALAIAKENHELDKSALEAAGFTCDPSGNRPYLYECLVRKADQSTVLQWSIESVCRYFPLLLDESIGIHLHPFDLATNKVFALIGRAVVRDWVDILLCHQKLQNFGLLAWAAVGKDPGLSMDYILAEASRGVRYSREEYDELEFEGTPPDPVGLVTIWRSALAEAHSMLDIIPPQYAGTAVLNAEGTPWRGSLEQLRADYESGQLHFHEPRIGGCWPNIVG